MRTSQIKPGSRSLALAHLREAQLINTKTRLPAEILEQILASLSVQDLLRWARVSKRLRKLIYDDARWLARLKAMDCLVPQPTTKSPRSIPGRTDPNGKNSRVQSLSSEQNGSAYRPPIPGRYPTSPIIETEKDLQITAISMLEVDPFSLPPGGEGYARHQYEAVHRMIQPCYEAIVRTLGDQDVELPGPPLNTIQYAHVIGRVQRFAKGDLSVYGHRRRLKVQSASERLEQTELGNFHLNLESNQFSVAKANVQALRALDKGSSAIKQYIEDNPLFVVKESIGDAEECLEEASSGRVDFVPAERFMAILTNEIIKQSETVDKCFPPGMDVMEPFLTRLGSDILAPYASYLFDEAYRRNKLAFVIAVPGYYNLCLRLQHSLRLSNYLDEHGLSSLQAVVSKLFQPKVELYLTTETATFKEVIGDAIDEWNEQARSQNPGPATRSISTGNRQADKRDFLASFKKVVMMPVNVMPTLVMKPMRQILTTDGAENSRAASPNPSSHRNPNIVDSTTAAELAAKATMINKRLEGIKSLLSIDLTLRLIQSAKAVIERLGVFIRDSPIPTSKIQDNCQSVFVQLLHTLGERHLKPGFDQAISLLEPDKASEEQSNSDALTGFAEMINVCDLIQQMVDVFYEEELCSKQLSDRNSFTDSASKEKKAFEQSLDEWVASGLNRGLEAILNRIQAALTTKQLITDYDPEAAIYDVAKLKTPAARAKANQRESMQLDFATTPTAATNDVCEVLSTPVQSLRGAIDASILDVFYTELGLRLFGALRKHILRMRISTRGATQLMIDMAAYYEFVDKTLARSIKNQASSKDICLYFESLRRVAEIYLVSGDAKLLIPMVTDQDRWKGIFDREEILEFISRRADWLTIRKSVEKGLDGTECTIM